MDRDAIVKGLVKGLSWQGNNGFWRSYAIGGVYEILEVSGVFHLSRIDHGHGTAMKPYPTLAAAQAAAESDYRARSRALDDDPWRRPRRLARPDHHRIPHQGARPWPHRQRRRPRRTERRAGQGPGRERIEMTAFLQCDADGCGHHETVPEISRDLIGKPCPKCGANLLKFPFGRGPFPGASPAGATAPPRAARTSTRKEPP